jgi:hypothetical protein
LNRKGTCAAATPQSFDFIKGYQIIDLLNTATKPYENIQLQQIYFKDNITTHFVYYIKIFPQPQEREQQKL